MNKKQIFLISILCLVLPSCNTTTTRALYGGAIGAGTGAAAAAATGGSVQKGAIIGGGIGAAAGAVTH